MTYQAVERSATKPLRTHFLRFERLVVLVGASGLGAGAGFVTAVALGRQDMWTQLMVAAPVLALALYFASATFAEAQQRKAYGCGVMAACHGISLIAWPLFVPLQGMSFFMAPAAALLTVLALASCWNGSPAAIYRAALQALLVAALAAYQGALVLLTAA